MSKLTSASDELYDDEWSAFAARIREFFSTQQGHLFEVNLSNATAEMTEPAHRLSQWTSRAMQAQELIDVLQTTRNLEAREAIRQLFHDWATELPPTPKSLLTPGGRAEVGRVADWYESSLPQLLSDVLRVSSQPENDAQAVALENVRQLATGIDLQLARRAAAAAREAATSSREAAGVSASSSLATEFHNHGKSARSRAYAYQVLALAVLVGTVVFTGLVAFDTDNDVTRMLQKLAVAVPALVLSGYLARESGRNAAQADWAEVLSVQMKSLRAYLSELEPDSRQELILLLGHRAFSADPAWRDHQPKGTETTGSLEGVDHVAGQIIDLAKILQSHR
jgi:hypothetical protein